MVKQSSIRRGKKWYSKYGDNNEWCNTQEAIVEDINNYLDSIKVEEKPKTVKIKEVK